MIMDERFSCFPFQWQVSAADPELLVAAQRDRPERVARWDVGGYDRIVLDLIARRMEEWQERYLWAVSAPLGELAARGERARVTGHERWDIPAGGHRALERFGLPARLFTCGPPSRDAAADAPGRYVLAQGEASGGGRVFWVQPGTGRVALPWDGNPDRVRLAHSLVAFVEIAWRWSWAERCLADAGVHAGWEAWEVAEVEDDFRDLVRWIDPGAEFAEFFPVVEEFL